MSVGIAATVTYAPPVPAMDPLPLLALAILVGAALLIPQKWKAKSAIAVLISLSWAAIFQEQIQIISKAYAVPPPIELTSASGGTANLTSCDTAIPLDNLTSSDLRITAITLVNATAWANPAPSTPQCAVGDLISANATNACYLKATGCPP